MNNPRRSNRSPSTGSESSPNNAAGTPPPPESSSERPGLAATPIEGPVPALNTGEQEKITIPWLLNRVPASYWLSAAGTLLTALIAALVLGIKLADIPPVRELLGVGAPNATSSQNLPSTKISSGKSALSSYLENHDPNIFYSGKDGQYLIARVLPDQAALYGQTSMADELRDANASFDILVNTGGDFVRHFKPAIESAIKRGVAFRFILSDYTEVDPEIKRNFDAFAKAVGQAPMEARGACENMRAELEELQNRINTDKGTYRGSLEFRWNERPLLYTLWVRDRNQPTAIAHLSVHMYRGKSTWPSFRFGKDAQAMTNSLTDEFEYIWERSPGKTAAEMP